MTERARGLKSIEDARRERKQNRFGKRSPNEILAVLGGVVLVGIIAWYFGGRSLSRQKDALLGQQRAAVATLGAEWFPLRDLLEKTAVEEAANASKEDFVLPEARGWDFRTQPGIYLRLRVAEAKDTTNVHKAAGDSLRDAFVACLLKGGGRTTSDPDAGVDGADSPWNLREAYLATRVLDDAWANEVREATNDQRLKVFEQQYDKAKATEIPKAIEIVKRAKYFLLVLDEDVPEAAKHTGDAGVITSEALQLVPHPARVVLVQLGTNKTMARIRRVGGASFLMAGEHGQVDEETRNAMQRQVNNCALANEVTSALK